MKQASDKRTVVEEGTHFSGVLSSATGVEVRGRVEGELTAPSLTVQASGEVFGTVRVDEAVCHGALAGRLEVSGKLVLSGRVADDTAVRAAVIEVAAPSETSESVQFGECELEIGEAPRDPAS